MAKATMNMKKHVTKQKLTFQVEGKCYFSAAAPIKPAS